MTPVGVFFICQNEDKCHFVNSTKLTRCEVDKLKFMVLHRCSYFNQITVQIIKTNYFLSPTMCHKFINILN